MTAQTIEPAMWADLAGEGFELRAPHAAWRHWDGGIDSVHLLWERDRTAFRLVAAVQFHAVPLPSQPRLLRGRLAPTLAQCHAKRAYAPGPARADLVDRELWISEGDRDALAGDLRAKARRAARSLAALHRPGAALEQFARRSRWHPQPGTPGWLELTGYLAAAVGEYEVARPRLQRLLRELGPDDAGRAERIRSALTLLP